jgi:hypothetical protein
MSNKSQINQLSKRELVESLLARQQQDSSTMNRLILSVALAAGVEPEALAQKFADGDASRNFAERFNKALDAEFQKREQVDKSAADTTQKDGENELATGEVGEQ